MTAAIAGALGAVITTMLLLYVLRHRVARYGLVCAVGLVLANRGTRDRKATPPGVSSPGAVDGSEDGPQPI